jgi:hypothetical protein
VAGSDEDTRAANRSTSKFECLRPKVYGSFLALNASIFSLFRTCL